MMHSNSQQINIEPDRWQTETNDKDFWSYDLHPIYLAPFTEPVALFTKILTTKIKQIYNPVSFRSIEIFIFFPKYFLQHCQK